MFVSSSAKVPKRAEKITLSSGTPSCVIDTQGLSALLCVNSGLCYINGSERAATIDSYPMNSGDTLGFSGKLNVIFASVGESTSTDLRALYFDSI